MKKKSRSRTHKPVPKHRKITYRILFALALTFFIFKAIAGIIEPDDQPVNKLANNTRSESAQLKAQIALQQMEVDALKNKLQRYEDLYGPLDEPEAEPTASPEPVDSEDNKGSEEADSATTEE